MQIHDITKNSANKTSIKIGRGGKRGKTSGAGTKGQKARAGTSGRSAMRDIIKKIPKLRGQGVNGNKNKSIIVNHFPVNLSIIDEKFNEGEKVNLVTLLEKGIIKKTKGKLPWVKILGNGEISKKLEINSLKISETAKTKIEKAGGNITE